MNDIEYVGADAIRQAQALQLLGHDPSGWDTFLKSPDAEEYWLLWYPDSSAHGGGVPRLTRSSHEAWLHNQSLKPTLDGTAAYPRSQIDRSKPATQRLIESQKWKLWLAAGTAIVAGVLMWFDEPIAALLGVPRYSPQLLGTLVGLLTIAGASLAIRCPNCRLSLVWFGLSKQPLSQWLNWLLDAEACPRCGYRSHHGKPL